MTIHIITHDDCLAHDPGAGHPENPRRLAGILAALEDAPFRGHLAMVDATLGTEEQVLLAHSPGHLEKIRTRAPATGEASLDPDTYMSPGSLNAALRAVGAACQGVDDLMQGTCQSVFCATRPPGHHATPDRAMGFCLFNQIAIAAIYAKRQYQLDRVAIVDFDVHHGNGTQDIVRGREGIFYISTHQSPMYPGTGGPEDNIDFNILNLPLPGGTVHDAYTAIFQAEILPALEAFRPRLLLVSAGFDAHAADPLAGMDLTDETYRWLGKTLQQVANAGCEGRLLSTLEGGYNLQVLPGSVLSYLQGSLDAMA